MHVETTYTNVIFQILCNRFLTGKLGPAYWRILEFCGDGYRFCVGLAVLGVTPATGNLCAIINLTFIECQKYLVSGINNFHCFSLKLVKHFINMLYIVRTLSRCVRSNV